MMCWGYPGEKPVVKTTIQEDDAAATRPAELWAKEMEHKSGSGSRMWCTDGSQTDNRRVGAATVCLN